MMLGNKIEIPAFLSKVKACDAVPEENNDADVVEQQNPELTPLETQENFMTNAKREKLANTIKAMSPDQLIVIVDNIPIELVFNRIGRELERNKQFMKAVTQAMTIIKEK